MRAAGVTWDREDFLWSDIERRKGSFDWSRAGRFVNLAKQYGIEVMPIVDYDTSWSSLSAGTFDVTAYANFAAQIVRRYPSIHAIELWNEPFMNYAWGNAGPTARYAAIVRAAATAVKAANPNVKVGAEVDLRNYADGSPYFDDFLKADPPSTRCSTSGPSIRTRGTARRMRPASTVPPSDRTGASTGSEAAAVAASRGASLPIWITEWGYTTASSGVSEATQAKYIADGITRAVTEWGVERVFAYTGDKDGTNPDDKEAHYGMRHADGSEKPVWASLRTVRSPGRRGPPPTTGSTRTTTAPPPPPPPTTTTAPPPPPPTTGTTTAPPPPPPPTSTTTTVTTTTPTLPPPPPTTTATNNGKKKGHAQRTLAVEASRPPRRRRRAGSGRGPAGASAEASPVVRPCGERPPRPRAAPATIPAWAWRRLAVVSRPGVARTLMTPRSSPDSPLSRLLRPPPPPPPPPPHSPSAWSLRSSTSSRRSRRAERPIAGDAPRGFLRESGDGGTR